MSRETILVCALLIGYIIGTVLGLAILTVIL